MNQIATSRQATVEPRPARLVELELSIDESRQAGFKACVEIGKALLEIREAQLYQQDYGTFDAYCQSRWGFTERRAHQYMRAVEIGTRVPIESEKQARELARLEDPGAQIRAWNEAAERATRAGRSAPTSADVRFAVEARRGRSEKPPRQPATAKKKLNVDDAPAPSKSAGTVREDQSPASRASTYAECCSRHSAAIRSLLPELEAAVLSTDPETAKGWHAASAELAELATQATELIHAAAQASKEAARLGIEVKSR